MRMTFVVEVESDLDQATTATVVEEQLDGLDYTMWPKDHPQREA